MRKITLLDRLRYAFDNTMSRGPVAMVAWLGLVTMLMVAGAACALSAFHLAEADLGENLWTSLMRAMDPGAVAGDTGWSFRAVTLSVTVGGIFILSTLIGILSSGLQTRLDRLRKGRSFVLEQGHTLILGWSPKVFTIVSELVIANENQRRPAIVILADRDKVEMEDDLRSRIPNTRNTRVICRSGSPCDPADLEIANPFQARSIIIPSPEQGNGDSQTIKTILAITNSVHRRPEPYHIVAELQDPRNLEVARLVGKEEVELLLADELISRIMVQTSRQSGLSIVYTELMDFEGDEIYFAQEPTLTGQTFGDALFAYEDSSVIGVQFADGRVALNPPMDTRITAADRIIAISEDDDTLRLSPSPPPPVDPAALRSGSGSSRRVDRTLVLGWNRRAAAMIRELDHYVLPESRLRLVASYDVSAVVDALRPQLGNLTLEFLHADTTDRKVLDGLGVENYNHILLLCYREQLEVQEADAQTLITLLHLRNLAELSGLNLSIVSEMLDLRNRELAEVTKADDFIVSDNMISLLMSQISENKHLMRVFDDLFQDAGSEIYLKPAGDYVVPGTPLSFYAVLESARAQGQVALGYRQAEYQFDASRAYGVVVNPKKSEVITLMPEDKVIVLAED